MIEKKSNRPQNIKSTGMRLLRMSMKYKFRLFAACVCMAISSAATVRGTYYLKPMVDDYFVPLIGQSGIDTGLLTTIGAFLRGEESPLWGAVKLMLLMAIAYTISMIAALIEEQLMVSIGNKMLLDLRKELYSRILRQPLSAVESKPAGALMSSFTNDMDGLGNMLRRSLPYMVNGTVTCVAIFITMLRVHVWLALVTLFTVLMIIPILNWLAKKSMKHTAKSQVSLMELNSIAGEYLQSQEFIRISGMENQVYEKYAGSNKKLFENTFSAGVFSNGIFSVTNGINQLGYAIVLMAGATMALMGAAQIGTVALIAQYYSQFYKPLTDMTKQISNILSALAGAERIFNVMDVPLEEDDGKRILDLASAKGQIVMENITFGYNHDKEVLKGVNLDIHSGEKVAVLGTTGAGKTTLISLLNRLYEIWDGSLKFDGIPMKDINKKSLRKAIVTVSQDTHLFTGTVADNLRFGKSDATDDELWEAARLVGADFFISHLPKGMETMVCEGSDNLSQGERQLLSITRAAVANAPVLILDEATSSIDTYTEKKINEALDMLMKGRTVLVIAHRLTTVQNADKIVVMDKGRIVEMGSSAELIQKKGYYYRLINA